MQQVRPSPSPAELAKELLQQGGLPAATHTANQNRVAPADQQTGEMDRSHPTNGVDKRRRGLVRGWGERVERLLP